MRVWQQRSPLMSKWNTDYTPTLWILENNVRAKRLHDRPVFQKKEEEMSSQKDLMKSNCHG